MRHALQARSSCLLVLLLLALAVPSTRAAGPVTRPTPVPMIHVTDLFRPHNDPDDHWDLACAFALACQGRADLLAVLIDYPAASDKYDPDVLAVAQMNFLTGKSVPAMVGSERSLATADVASPANAAALRGARGLLELMRRSTSGVVISILGSSRDVALAAQLDPKLFAEKCAAVYLNAGAGTRDPAKTEKLEWNVRLDQAAYAAIFDLPCPVYWLPCFEIADDFRVSEWGSFYRFRQGEVLPQLSDGTQNFFAYMFKHGALEARHQPPGSLRPDWLRSLTGRNDPALLQRINAMDRNMWCTAGFLHAAGLAVNRDGTIVAIAAAKEPVFTFDPIEVTCSARGVTQWRPAASAQTRRFIFHVRDLERYQSAITAALRTLLKSLP